MATKRYYSCAKCPQRTYQRNLFDALLDLSRGLVSNCAACGGSAELHLLFDFGLGASSVECKVLHAFLPSDLVSWKQKDGEWVTFYPFLVVMERTDVKDRAFWLPYWHTVEGTGMKKRKYGQWAPFMDEPLFKSLLAQAREKGCLPE